MRADAPWVRVPPLVRVPVDRCPKCGARSFPRAHHDDDDCRRCFHECHCCGHRWTVAWSIQALGGPDPMPGRDWPDENGGCSGERHSGSAVGA